MELSRRHLLQLGGVTAVAAAGVSLPFTGFVAAKSASELDKDLLPRPFRTPFVFPRDLKPIAKGTDEFGPYVSYVVNELPARARLLNTSLDTTVWGYQGLPTGPTLHVEAGERAIVKMRNRLPEVHPLFGHRFVTATHLHGNASLPQYDGYANDFIPPGYSKIYQWPAHFQPARTIWYHDHAAHVTAQNVYGGLAGQYHVHDDLERALLPQRPFDVPLTLTDVMFDEDGELGYDDRDHSGLWGDVILVNGRPWPVLRVQRRVYRFRMLNASVARSYRPKLSPEGAVHMVGTDGGMMPVSQQVTEWRVSPGERYEFLVNFAQYKAGQRVVLRNRSNENNRDFDETDKIMAFDVTDEPVDTSDPTWNRIPTVLTSSAAMNLRRDQAVRERKMRFHRDDKTDIWQINGRTWADVIDSGFQEVFADPALGDVEIWKIENRGGGWFHPVHIHLVDFQILSRNRKAPFAYERGPKDVLYLGGNETVELIMKFGPHRGKYMIHCHNLSHEDHDMMVQFSVGLKAGEPDPNDPIKSDPAFLDTDGNRDVPPPTAPPQ